MVVFQPILTRVQAFALDEFKDNVDEIHVGDDGTAPLESQTDVINQIGSAVLEEVDESVAGQLTFISKFGISEFIGSTIREASLFDSITPEGYTRNLTVEKLKGADQIFWVTIPVKAEVSNA